MKRVCHPVLDFIVHRSRKIEYFRKLDKSGISETIVSIHNEWVERSKSLRSILNESFRETAFRTPRFTVRALLFTTTVFAVSAANVAHLWRAAQGEKLEFGWFAITTAMTPLGLMIASSWFYRLFKLYAR